MKVCYLAGASSIHTIRWVNALAVRGHEVHLITMHRPELDDVLPNVKLYLLKIPAPLGYYANTWEVKRLLKKIKPELLHVHYASGYGTLARLVDYKPTLLSVWGSDVYLFPYEGKRNEQILRKNLETAFHITSTSHAMKEQTEKFVNPATPIDTVPFGIDLQKFQPKPKEERDTITIGTIKSLKPIYGIDILIKATALLVERIQREGQSDLAERIRLMIVGGGGELPNLQQIVQQLGMQDRTEFKGPVSNEQVPDYLNQLDIYCALSRSESFGVAVVEASACEVPVIVSHVGGLPEVVDHNQTGYVVDHENMDMVVDHLYKLVIDEETRQRFGKNGRDFVSRLYDWDKNVTEMEAVYDRTVDRFLKQ